MVKMNDVYLKAKMNLVDNQAREFIKILETKIITINERTKGLVIEVRNLKKELKDLAKLK